MELRATGYVPTPSVELERGKLLYGRPKTFGQDAEYTRTTILPAPAPVDQGELPSCTGNAVAKAVQILHPGTPDLSRYWPWWEVCKRYGGPSGTAIHDVCDVSLGGLPLEELFPHPLRMEDLYEYGPDFYPHDTMAAHRILQGDPVQAVIGALQLGHPVVVGTEMDHRAWYEAPSQGGVVSRKGEVNDFYHAIYLYGWDYEKKLFLGRNSWGPWLGDIQPISLAMTAGDISFTEHSLRTVFYELRELTPEPVSQEDPPIHTCPRPVSLLMSDGTVVPIG